MVLNPVDMVFDYKGTYPTQTPEAYETLLLDCMQGDQTLFMRGDQVEAAWEIHYAHFECMGNQAKSEFSELCGRHMGTRISRGSGSTGWLSLVYASAKS
jgi:glucose-6-phosphate 1-dehydrogenase